MRAEVKTTSLCAGSRRVSASALPPFTITSSIATRSSKQSATKASSRHHVRRAPAQGATVPRRLRGAAFLFRHTARDLPVAQDQPAGRRGRGELSRARGRPSRRCREPAEDRHVGQARPSVHASRHETPVPRTTLVLRNTRASRTSGVIRSTPKLRTKNSDVRKISWPGRQRRAHN